jgi:DNA-binding NarL/FixJ family response regulator
VAKPEEISVPPAAVYVLEASGVRRADETLAETLVRRRPGNRVIVIAEKFGEDETFPLLGLGVKGLIRYADVEESLARALREVGRGGYWVPRSLLSRFVERLLAAGRPRALPSAVHLSPREREVIDLLLENRSNKQIASELSISERTAKFHVGNLLAKNGVKRRADLILLGLAPGRKRPQ